MESEAVDVGIDKLLRTMRKLLLTSGQVSVLLTLFITLSAISLVFIAGVLSQSRTTTRLRANLTPVAAKHALSPAAIVLPVPSESQLCSAALLCASLPGDMRRVLLFPASWADAGFGDDPYLSSARRLLRRLVRRWGIEILPVEDGELAKRPIGAMAGVRGLERAVMLRTPGLLGNADRLKALLDTQVSGVGVAYDESGETNALVLDVDKVLNTLDGAEVSEDGVSPLDSKEVQHLLSQWPGKVTPLDGITTSLAMLRNVSADESFAADVWLKQVGWLTFTDPLLPLGPEVQVPYDQMVLARPTNPAADWLWTSLYGDFAEKRREICGLGLKDLYT